MWRFSTPDFRGGFFTPQRWSFSTSRGWRFYTSAVEKLHRYGGVSPPRSEKETLERRGVVYGIAALV
jgi:hypothetical protein